MKKLKRDINLEREMRARNQRIRILGLKMNGDQTDVGHVLQNVFTRLVNPILNLAVEKGDIAEVPRCQAVLEFGHILPVNDKSSEARTPSIIIWFQSRYYRQLVFKYKKQFLSRSRTSSSAEVPASNIYKAEDLTGPTYRRLKAMLMELKTY